jgi:anaerobic selenocysteine-containing dehydrogenase
MRKKPQCTEKRRLSMDKSLEKEKFTRRQFLKVSGGVAALAALAGKLFPSPGQLIARAAGTGESGTTVTHGFCHSCHFGKCNILYTVKDGVLVHVEGDPQGLWNAGTACVKGQAFPAFVYNPYRVKTPLKRTNPQKGLDVDPGWVEISWEEAIDTLSTKLKAIREDDPRKLMWSTGFPGFYNALSGRGSIFLGVFGSANEVSATGSMCSVHLSNGLVHGGFVQWPDYDYAKYVLAVGGTFGPNHAASDGGTGYVIDAIKKGMKVVVVDPRASPEARLGEWVPIRPGTEFPYMLAITHVILHEIGKIDEWFVKNRTTGPYLIAQDTGDYLRDPETQKPLVWDSVEGVAKTFDAPVVQDYALEGSFEVNGAKAQPAFDLLKQGMKGYTPEWAAELTTIPAETIRRHSNELIEAAKIGSTIQINGFTFPLRPALVYMGRGMASHRDGHLAFWMSMVINQLIGAVDVPGGNLVMADPNALKPNEDGVVTPEARHSAFHPFEMPPKTIDAPEFLPYTFSGGYRWIDAVLEPEKYQLDYQPEMYINVAHNFFTKGGDPERISEALSKIPYTVSYAYHIDEVTAFADLVLPDATYIEQPVAYNFAMNRPGHGTLVDIYLAHKAAIKPLYNARIPDEVWMDVAERMGMLYGPGPTNLNFMANKRLGLKPEYELALDKKYTTADIFDRVLRSKYGDAATLDAVAEKGYFYQAIQTQEQYNYYYFPGNKTRHPLYNVYFKRAGEQLLAGLKKAGLKHPGLSEEDIRFYYQGVPAWKSTPIQNAPADFDLYGVVWKIPEFMFDISATESNSWLVEAAGTNPDFGKILLNTATAARKGLANGDLVYMESQFGGKIGPYPVKTTELLHPDCVGVVSGLGRVAAGMNPIVKKGIPYNRLLSTSWDSVEIITGGVEISPRMKLTKA